MQKKVLILFATISLSFQSIHSMEFLRNKLGLGSSTDYYNAEPGNKSCARFAKMLAYMHKKQPLSTPVQEVHQQLKEHLEDASEACEFREQTQAIALQSKKAGNMLNHADEALIAAQQATEGPFKSFKILMKIEADIIKDLSAARPQNSSQGTQPTQPAK
jgi:hypothetical protein